MTEPTHDDYEDWEKDPDRAEHMAVISEGPPPMPSIEEQARRTVEHNLAAAASWLDSPEATRYRAILTEASQAHVPPEVATDYEAHVPVTLRVDPFLAAIICRRQLGRLGMANVHKLDDIGHVLATYLVEMLADVEDDRAGMAAWVNKITGLHGEAVEEATT